MKYQQQIILKEFWGLGIGKALMSACIGCAKEAE